MNKSDSNEGDTFNVDTKVLHDGLYVCVPCGDKQRFKAGEMFPRCFECIDDQDNPEKLRGGLGLWELLESQETANHGVGRTKL